MAAVFGPLVLAALVPEEEGIENPARRRWSDHLQARGKTNAFAPVFVARDAEPVTAGLKPTATWGEFNSEGVVAPQDVRFVPFYRVYEEQCSVYLSFFSPEE